MEKTIIFTILVAGLVLTGCADKKNIEVEEVIPNETSDVQSTDLEEENDVAMGNDKIKIFEIEEGQTVSSPLTIKGETTIAKDNLIVELRNSDHVAIIKEYAVVNPTETEEMNSYLITLNFNFNNTKEGFIALYEKAGEDGSELDLVEIPVKFGN